VKGPVPHRCGALVVGGPYPRERIVAGDLAAILERSGSVIDSAENSDDRGDRQPARRPERRDRERPLDAPCLEPRGEARLEL